MICKENQITLKELESMNADEYYTVLETYQWYMKSLNDNG